MMTKHGFHPVICNHTQTKKDKNIATVLHLTVLLYLTSEIELLNLLIFPVNCGIVLDLFGIDCIKPNFELSDLRILKSEVVLESEKKDIFLQQ